MKSPVHILVVAEALGGAALCADLARRSAMNGVVASDAAAVDAQLAARRVDLVVLDLMLHTVNGLALTRALRSTLDMPVILLSGHGSAAERIVGLEMGADDCMDHPVIRSELVARIRAVLRRRINAASVPRNVIRFDGWELQRSERHLRAPSGASVGLSAAEFRLLWMFLQAPRRVVSRDDLAARTRGGEANVPGRRIDLLVSRLRQKLIVPGAEESLISTVRGVGYRFDARSVEGLTN
jgi:two-component system OmpR family response regulator